MSYTQNKYSLMDEGMQQPKQMQYDMQPVQEGAGIENAATGAATMGAATGFNPYVMAATFAVNMLNQKAQDERQRRANAAQIAQTDAQNKQNIYQSLNNTYQKALLG